MAIDETAHEIELPLAEKSSRRTSPTGLGNLRPHFPGIACRVIEVEIRHRSLTRKAARKSPRHKDLALVFQRLKMMQLDWWQSALSPRTRRGIKDINSLNPPPAEGVKVATHFDKSMLMTLLTRTLGLKLSPLASPESLARDGEEKNDWQAQEQEGSLHQ